MATRTPLYDRHVAGGARMVDFGGYDMPLQYTGTRGEHVAVRQHAGLFDISHMGEVAFTGPGALDTLSALVANDVAGLSPGRAQYGVMCNADGGVVDDVIVYRDSEEAFMVVVNAGCRDKDIAWMGSHLGPGCAMADESDATALLAVQGPRAADIVSTLAEAGARAGAGADILGLRPFHFTRADIAGIPSRVSRTGYTGEDGFELYVASDAAPRLWDALIDAGTPLGLRPAGLGARDTLRLEAGLRLYGQDMDETTDPLSAGLGWTVKLGSRDFVGSEALRAIAHDGAPKRFVGLALAGRAIARHGQHVLHEGRRVGEITSGTFGFTVGHGIATAYIDPSLGDIGSTVEVDIRGTAAVATICPLPFYRRPSIPRR